RRPEVVEQRAAVAEATHEPFPVRGRGGGAPVVAVLATHRRGPVGRVAIALREAGIAQDGPQDAGHVFVATHERWVVRETEAEDIAHVRVLLACKGIRGSATPSTAPSGRVSAAEPAPPSRALRSPETPTRASPVSDARNEAGG